MSSVAMAAASTGPSVAAERARALAGALLPAGAALAITVALV